MECGTRLHTPLPKKRFQRLCLRKNINSCPPKSVQFQNKENDHHGVGLSPQKVINMSGRLSSPGYRLEHRTTPTFVTIRRPRHIIPSPLSTSGSNMDSDSSQFVVSGYFSTNSSKSVHKPYLAFSTPIDNNDSKNFRSHNFTKSDNVEIRRTSDSEKQRISILIKNENFPNMMNQIKEDLCNSDVIISNTNNDISKPKTFDIMESLNIFDKECYTDSVPIHFKENNYRTPENCIDILKKLTPQTASIMDNLYGDVWKSTPGLFKKSKSRIDPTLKLEKFCIDDGDIADKLDTLQIDDPFAEIKSKHQPTQSSIKRFFKSSSRNIPNQSHGEHAKGINPTLLHFDKVDDVYILKDCLKDDHCGKDINSVGNILVKKFDELKNDKLPMSDLNSDFNDTRGVFKFNNVVDLTDDKNINPAKADLKKKNGLIYLSKESFQSLNDTDDFLFIRKPFLGNENISKPIEMTYMTGGCLNLKTDNYSKNILKEQNTTEIRKPKNHIVSENSTTTKIDHVSCEPYNENAISNINEGIQTDEIKCNRSIERNKKHNDPEMKLDIKRIKSQKVAQTKKGLKLKRTPEINIHNTEKGIHITKPNSNERIESMNKIIINDRIKEQKIKLDKNNFEDPNDLDDADLKKRNLSLEVKLKNIADNYSKLQTKFSKPNKRCINDPIKDSRYVMDIKNSESLKYPKKLGSNDIKSHKSKSDISNRVNLPPKHKYIQPKEKTKKIIENTESIIKTQLNLNDLKIGRKPAHRKNDEAKEKIKEMRHEKVDADLFDTLINTETVKINSNLDDSCEILTVRKKKIDYFHSSDSDDESGKRLDDLHFDLQPKTLVFESNDNVDLREKPKKTAVKKSLRERNSAKSLTISKAIPVSTDTQLYSFMASLADNVPSWRCDPDAKCFKKNFKSKRDELTKKLFMMFNDNVFESKLPHDLLIEWSVNLTKTAGRAHNKVIKHRSKPSVPPVITRKSHVELSAKVVDGTQRLRDTLAHELCHVATWLIDGQLNDGHGPCWKTWVAKTLKRYPEIVALPVCHTLDIHYKYTYKCVKCGYSIGRHSKSIDTTKKRCGYCYGTLECIHNKKNKDGLVISTPVGQKRQATGFALYVKENYGNVRGVNTPHKEAMKYLGKQYTKMKIDNQEAVDGK